MNRTRLLSLIFRSESHRFVRFRWKKCQFGAFLAVAAASRGWVRGFPGSVGAIRSAYHAQFEVGASNPKPAGVLALVKLTQAALAAAHKTRSQHAMIQCARSTPWILASAAAPVAEDPFRAVCRWLGWLLLSGRRAKRTKRVAADRALSMT